MGAYKDSPTATPSLEGQKQEERNQLRESEIYMYASQKTHVKMSLGQALQERKKCESSLRQSGRLAVPTCQNLIEDSTNQKLRSQHLAVNKKIRVRRSFLYV